MSSRQSRDSGYRGSLGDGRHWGPYQQSYRRGPHDRSYDRLSMTDAYRYGYETRDRTGSGSDSRGNARGNASESSISRADEEMDDFGRQRRRDHDDRRDYDERGDYPHRYDRRGASPRRSLPRRDRSRSPSPSLPFSRRGPSPPWSASTPAPPLRGREPSSSPPPPPPPPPPSKQNDGPSEAASDAPSSPIPPAPTFRPEFGVAGLPAKTRSPVKAAPIAGRNNLSAADEAIARQVQSEGQLPERQSKTAAVSRITEIAADDIPLTGHTGRALSETRKNVRKRERMREKRAEAKAADAAVSAVQEVPQATSIGAVAAPLPVENGTSQPASVEPSVPSNLSADPNPNANANPNPNPDVAPDTGDPETKRLAASLKHIADQLTMAVSEVEDGQLQGPHNTVSAMVTYLKSVEAGMKRLKTTRVKLEKLAQK